MTEVFEGGCLCGRVRYRATAPPVEVGYCHCRMCQKNSGGPAMVYAMFPIDAFEHLGAAPKVFASSAQGERWFCAECGSPIEFRERPEAVYASVNVGTLDEPERLAPTRHIWCESRISWFDAGETLPRDQRDG